MRFRPEQHLRRQNDIRAVREQGRRVECRAFTIWWKSRDAATGVATPAVDPAKPVQPAGSVIAGARVCVIASRAAVGGAVARNRAKRRLREVFRQQQAKVPAACDFLLIARAAATQWPIAELEKKFADACRLIAPKEPLQP